MGGERESVTLGSDKMLRRKANRDEGYLKVFRGCHILRGPGRCHEDVIEDA